MIFIYDGKEARLYNDTTTNIIQTHNPYIDKNIQNKEDAQLWLRHCLANTFDAMSLCITISSENEELYTTNKEYQFNIKESTGQLTGSYKIKFKGQEHEVEQDIMFTDGEATVTTVFKYSDVYNIDFSDEFYIGKQKYICIIDRSEDTQKTSNNNILAINIVD